MSTPDRAPTTEPTAADIERAGWIHSIDAVVHAARAYSDCLYSRDDDDRVRLLRDCDNLDSLAQRLREARAPSVSSESGLHRAVADLNAGISGGQTDAHVERAGSVSEDEAPTLNPELMVRPGSGAGDVDAIIERARDEISRLCAGRGGKTSDGLVGRSWTMSVPVQADDSDMVFSDLLNLARRLSRPSRSGDAGTRDLIGEVISYIMDGWYDGGDFYEWRDRTKQRLEELARSLRPGGR